MKDPKRLFDEGSPLERSILSAAREESPPEDLERRILAAIAVAPGGGGDPSPSGGPSRLPLPRAVVAGIAAIGLGALVIGASLRKNEPAPAAPPAHAAPAIAAPPAPATTTADAPREPTVTPDTLPDAPARAAASAPARAAASPAPSGVPTASIAREVELLDGVKAKLGAGAADDASRALDAYDAEFPQGTLRPEATVLRIRTLLARGERARAEKLADDFLAKHPSGVHAKRIRALLEQE